MKRLLVATDFSAQSHPVLAWAAQFALALPAKVVLLHAQSIAYPATELPTDPMVMLAPLPDEGAAQTALDRQADDLRQQGIACETRLVSDDLTEALRDDVAETPTDFVVLGRRAEASDGWLAQLFGTSATDVVAKLNVPVLMVPAEASEGPVRRIVYATQLEWDETAVLRQTFDLARALGASVQLVKLNAPFEPNLARDEDFIADIRQNFSEESFELTTREADTVSGGLVAFAEEVGADLLILTSHHHSLLDQLITPSKAKQVLVQTTLPTLVFPLA
ncbi:MAG: universal stress protein [Sphingobacteriaceae bacterium]|nr:universal stress protein [Cytophagaceae bacterium]